MGVITTISTVDKSAWVQQGQIEIRTPTNARPTMSIRFRDKTPLAAYRPPVDAEITVKDGCDAPGALTMLEKGGGEVPNGTWYFRLVAKDAAGRWSLPGPQGSITTVGGATQDIQFDWTAVDLSHVQIQFVY